ncbi:MAG: class I tRNA ligase family protein, partial [Bdellovibrio sp.]
MSYQPREIEKKWQKIWLKNRVHRALNPGDPGFRPEQKPFYVLDMFPYPSGSGLHVGHASGYIGTDIIARKKRMDGFNVLHPMGWDAFGLPAEQYALQTGQHPRVTTDQNTSHFRTQLQNIGLSYDWDREIDTSHPSYYRWTQWIFLQLYKQGLVDRKQMP